MRQQIVHRIKNKRGAVLLLTLVMTVFLTVLLGAAMQRSDVQIREVIQRRQMQEAFYAAETGIDIAVFNLRENAAWRPGQGSNPAIVDVPFIIPVGSIQQTVGFYSINVQNAPIFNGWNSCWITAQGQDSTRTITRQIRARVIVESPTRFLISTLGPLRFASGARLDADTLAKDVFFDVNPSMTAPQNEIHLNGDVFYINSVTNGQDPAIVFSPGKGLNQSTAITFAGVDTNRYEGLATTFQTQNSGLNHNGNLPINLNNISALNPTPSVPFAPRIIYASGDITISGQYSDSILIVAGGNIYIDGDIVPDPNLPTTPQIGLFAKGDVIIPTTTAPTGTLNIEAFILADGGIPGSQGVFLAQGPKFSKGQLNFTGSVSARGAGQTGVDLNAFSTRNYTFNPNLNNNRTIPFTPFIVNIVQWQEI